MMRVIAVICLSILLAGCGATPRPEVVEDPVFPSVSGIRFQVYSRDGSELTGAAKVMEMLEVRGHCALSDAASPASIQLAIDILGRSRDGRVTIHNSALAEVTGDNLSQLDFSAEVAAPVKPGMYAVRVQNTFKQNQSSEMPLRVE